MTWLLWTMFLIPFSMMFLYAMWIFAQWIFMLLLVTLAGLDAL